jgi:glutathione synthase/RimK-type ligase-like ATP-grasp enzyme
VSVLIIGQSPDPHIEHVSRLLFASGLDPVVLDRRDSRHAVTCDFGRRGLRIRVRTRRRTVDLAKVRAIWWRVKPSVPAEFPGGLDEIGRTFAAKEWAVTLRSLPALTPGTRWVNAPDAQRAIAFKPRQLALAAACGLRIPATVITNDPTAARALFRRSPRVVYKTVGSFLVPPDEIIFTNEVRPQDLARSARAIQLAPGIFQAYVEKAHELRVTVVGEAVFVAEIDSQSAAPTRIDWRRDQMRAMYSVGRLTDETRRRLLKFHRRAGLIYAAYDFVVDHQGREVFLECNPGGQWLWLEERLGLPIGRALAEALEGWTKISCPRQRGKERGHGQTASASRRSSGGSAGQGSEAATGSGRRERFPGAKRPEGSLAPVPRSRSAPLYRVR